MLVDKPELLIAAPSPGRTAAALLWALIITGWMPAPAFAQVSAAPRANQPAPRIVPPRTIRVGETINSEIPENGPMADGILYQDYLLHLDANQTVRIDLSSPGASDAAPPPPATQAAPGAEAEAPRGFDTYLELRQAGNDTPVRTNDDSRGTLNSRIMFTSPRAADYVVRARPLSSIDSSQRRSFTLQVSQAASPPPPGELADGRVEGDIGATSPEDEASGMTRYAAYWITGRAQERVLLTMRSSHQGPSLQLADESGVVLANNVGYDSNIVRLITVLPRSARYLVQTHVPADQTAHYSLEMARAAEISQPVETVSVGQSLSRTLSLSSNGAGSASDGSGQLDFFYQMFALDLRVGQTVTIVARGTGFRPVLEAGTTSVLGFIPMLTGSEEEGRSQIVINPFQQGTVALRVRSSGLDVGDFQLSIRPGNAPGGQ